MSAPTTSRAGQRLEGTPAAPCPADPASAGSAGSGGSAATAASAASAAAPAPAGSGRLVWELVHVLHVPSVLAAGPAAAVEPAPADAAASSGVCIERRVVSNQRGRLHGGSAAVVNDERARVGSTGASLRRRRWGGRKGRCVGEARRPCAIPESRPWDHYPQIRESIWRRKMRMIRKGYPQVKVMPDVPRRGTAQKDLERSRRPPPGRASDVQLGTEREEEVPNTSRPAPHSPTDRWWECPICEWEEEEGPAPSEVPRREPEGALLEPTKASKANLKRFTGFTYVGALLNVVVKLGLDVQATETGLVQPLRDKKKALDFASVLWVHKNELGVLVSKKGGVLHDPVTSTDSARDLADEG
ncbi:hypothetical protein BDK51DRAFT_37824 [Blyttiomyces helicus]|uniref:Uncharacterized protein n=1 Tax=Blyttiomyces helicus TaxID=388810 RepID=A0A4P9W1A2_9FUNG|nr:hypothetical protein BDK51DRAFT_37824 [Blyttiomyces helicus]|eukprot:RKO84488.1 hypothetical protein BDK51DRAFT_37824 [Blyttiomyces helicus]